MYRDAAFTSRCSTARISSTFARAALTPTYAADDEEREEEKKKEEEEEEEND